MSEREKQHSDGLRPQMNENLEDVLSQMRGLAASVLSLPLSDIFACAVAPPLKVLAHMYRGAFHLGSVSASGFPVAPHWAGETDSEWKRRCTSWKSCHKRSSNMITPSCPERWMVKRQAFFIFLVFKLWGRQTNQLKRGERRRLSALCVLVTSLLALKAWQNELRSRCSCTPPPLLSTVLPHRLTSSAANYTVGSSSVSTQIKEKMKIFESLFLRDI